MSRLNFPKSVSNAAALSNFEGVDFITNIDPENIKIGSLSSLSSITRSRNNQSPSVSHNDFIGNTIASVNSIIANRNSLSEKEELTIEIQKSTAPLQTSFTFPGYFVSLSITFFCVTLVTSNLLKPSFTGTACLVVSPSGIIGISIHAIASAESLLISFGLLSSAWLLPLMCSIHTILDSSMIATNVFVCWLSTWIFFSLKKKDKLFMIPCFLIVCIITLYQASYLVTHHNSHHQLLFVVSCTSCFILHVFATRYSFRYNYTLRPLM